MARVLARRHRRDRGLQGVRARAGCSSRPATRSCRSLTPGRRAVRRRRDLRGARARGRRGRRLSAPRRAPTCSSSRRSPRTRSRSSRTGSPTTSLTEAALAHRGPLLVAPAMNPRMWAHPATQANAELLRARGVELIGPDEGELAEGESGVGRMAEPEAIVARCEELLAGARARCAASACSSRAGGTREPLDSVRFLGNRSSGRMGVALAAEARRRGADVTLLAANLAVPRPAASRWCRRRPRPISSARRSRARPTPTSCDGRRGRRLPPGRRARGEAAEGRRARGRSSSSRPTDVLAALGERRADGQVLVGFAADARRARARARARRSSRARTPTSSSSTTCRAPTSASTRPTTR